MVTFLFFFGRGLILERSVDRSDVRSGADVLGIEHSRTFRRLVKFRTRRCSSGRASAAHACRHWHTHVCVRCHTRAHENEPARTRLFWPSYGHVLGRVQRRVLSKAPTLFFCSACCTRSRACLAMPGHIAQVAMLHVWPYCTGGHVARVAILHGWPYLLDRAASPIAGAEALRLSAQLEEARQREETLGADVRDLRGAMKAAQVCHN